MSEYVHVVAGEAGVGALALSRPPTNALTRQAYREIAAAADEIGGRDDIATVILFGGHEIFCAGDDMGALRALSPAEADTVYQARHHAVAAVAAIPKPTVAAITGYALGSGLTLALAADWRVAGDNAKFGATEILAGLIPGSDGLTWLTRAAGASRAKELVFSGRFFDAEEALTLGLVDDMVAPDDVYDAAAAWAGRLAGGSAAALAAAKAGIGDVPDLPAAERLAAGRRRYLEVFAAASRSDDRG